MIQMDIFLEAAANYHIMMTSQTLWEPNEVGQVSPSQVWNGILCKENWMELW